MRVFKSVSLLSIWDFVIWGQFSPDSVAGVDHTEPFCQEKTNSNITECETWMCVALCESAEELLSLKIIKMVTGPFSPEGEKQISIERPDLAVDVGQIGSGITS